jgi:tryptophan synthase beta chain
MERRGYYGLKYGGQYMPESSINALTEVENEFEFVANDGCYTNEVDFFLYQYAGRKTPLYKCRRLSKACDGADIYLKREDIGINGSTAINFLAGQMIIGKRIGKTEMVFAAPNSDYALAFASAASAMELKSKIFMGILDYRKLDNKEVLQLKALGTDVFVIDDGKGSFYDAKDATLQYWNEHSETTMYIEHSAVGPHPYPKMVGELSKVVGEEVKSECLDTLKKLPEFVISPLHVGAISVGMFASFLEDEVQLVGIECENTSIMKSGKLGIHQGMCSLFLQDENDNALAVGIEPQHVALQESGRVRYETVSREEAKEAFRKVASLEGILPSFESSCAIAYAMKQASSMSYEKNIVVALAGKADESWLKECLEGEKTV